MKVEQNIYEDEKNKETTLPSRQACFVNRFTLQGFIERIFMTTVYIVENLHNRLGGKIKLN